MKKSLLLVTAVLGCAIMLGLALWHKSDSFAGFKQKPSAESSPELNLPSVDSVDKLKALMAEAQKNGPASSLAGKGAATEDQRAVPRSQASTYGGSSDYSQTNIQVQGVDEADIVKTDGSYIYQVNKQNVLIIQAQPTKDLKVVSRLNFTEEFLPREMYVDADRLVVIGISQASNIPKYTPSMPGVTPGEVQPQIYPPLNANSVKAIIYDLNNKTNPKQIREVELAGSYLTSRKIGSTLYLVTNKYADLYKIMNQQPENPGYRDSVLGAKQVSIDYTSIHYFPGSSEPNYLLIGNIDLNTNKEMQVSTFLGAGLNVYCSTTNLYVGVTKYEKVTPPASDTESQIPTILPPRISTNLYKFNLEKGQAKFTAQGDVPGTVLNQYSMDEAQGYLRIATTKAEWTANSLVTKNNLYILDSDLKPQGKLEDLAPGEKIYSARFIDNRAYIVTFKNMDPLFVVDLANPKNPKVLGTLKIPGFSTYLHPYSETELIGFGQDTKEVKDSRGNIRPLVGGMKVSLFDVSDVSNPREEFKEVIGDQGTNSELLHNPKALLFSREKNVMAFPITVMKQPTNNKVGQVGTIEFQGAYIYSLDPVKGFVLKGRVSHLSAEDYAKRNQNWNNFMDHSVNRTLYIGDTLYTLSNEEIKANELSTLKELNGVRLSKI